VEYRWTGGNAARAQDYAAQLVALKSDVILAIGTLSLRAAQKKTAAIPNVFALVGDPVGQGFVASLSRPGGVLGRPSLRTRRVQATRPQ
jgi:putative ABC transport system substrate-binding protein